MRRPRPLRLGRDGLTLVELLVVLAIAGLVMGVSVAAVGALADRMATPADELRELMSEVRMLAARRQEPVRMRFREGGYEVVALQQREVLQRGPIPVPELVAVPAAVTFFPGGTATAARLCVRQRHAWQSLRVDPVTGGLEAERCDACCR